MKRYFQIELFNYAQIDKGWWSIAFLRVECGNWVWNLFFMEENLDESMVEWFAFRIRK